MYRIGLDIGSTNTHIAIVDEAGKVVRTRSASTSAGLSYSEIVDESSVMIGTLMKEAGLKLSDIEAVGVGVPGAVDKRNGVVVAAYNLQWFDVPLAEEIKKHIDKPVFIANDTNCAALAELLWGVFKDIRIGLLLTLGTGLGSSLLIDGRIYNGRRGTGVEIGHVTINEGGLPCTCGNRGCLEVYCSAAALEREGRRAVLDYTHGLLYNAVKGDYMAVKAKHVIECAKRDDAIALSILNKYIETLGSAIASMINMLDPEVVGIGGGLSRNGDFLITKLSENVKKKLFFKDLHQVAVEMTKFGSEGGALGAAMLPDHMELFGLKPLS